jgi:hypothetical protein
VKEPTYAQIAARATEVSAHELAVALWYPQMGGYVGKCAWCPPESP